ncbi:MAG: alpha/beta hydrolase [Isosphaeraceae bacterium]
MPRAAVNGTDLAYKVEGTGRPLVFLPGMGGTSRMFGPQTEAFRPTHRVIRPDPRGTGRSGTLTGPAGTVLNTHCDDLAALLDHLRIGRVVAVGVSYGGAVALRFGLRHPDRVAGLVVSDTYAELSPANPTEAVVLLGSYLTLPLCYLPRSWLGLMGRRFYARWPAAVDAIPPLLEEFRPTEAILEGLAMCRAGRNRDLAGLDVPVLGIVGDFTRAGVRIMRRLTDAIPGARLEVVRDSFDPSNLCQPGEFNRLLAGFLRQIDSWEWAEKSMGDDGLKSSVSFA